MDEDVGMAFEVESNGFWYYRLKNILVKMFIQNVTHVDGQFSNPARNWVRLTYCAGGLLNSQLLDI